MRYIEIYSKLKADIADRKYPPETALPHISDLARIFDCSCNTIKNALKLLHREGLAVGIPSRGTFVRDTSMSFKNQAPERKKIGILFMGVLPNLATSYYHQFFSGIDHELIENNTDAHLILCKNKTIQDIIREIHIMGVSALITIEFDVRPLRREIERLKIPVVHIDQFDVRSAKHLLQPNYAQGSEDAIRILVKKGHRRILFLHPFYPLFQNINRANIIRWRGVRDAARKLKATCAREKVALLRQEEIPEAVAASLAQYPHHTGIILPGGQLFEPVKRWIADQGSERARAIDLVVFDLDTLPHYILGKPVCFCTWDGFTMGARAAEMVLAPKKDFPRFQYFPMRITTNEYQPK